MEQQATQEKEFELCKEYRNSGLTQKAFCEHRGISRSKLTYWLKKEREGKQGGAFVKVKPSVPVLEAGVLRIKIGERVMLELDHSVGEEELKKILHAVASL
jgi:transposase-like protein